MSWKEDRDALIAETMAFVQSVSGQGQSSKPATAELPVLRAIEALNAKPAPKATPPLAPVKVAEAPPALRGPALRQIRQGEFTNEIRARIASFRAHQERFNREREEYFSKTLAKLKATLN